MKQISELTQNRLFEVKPEYSKITNNRQLILKDIIDILDLPKLNEERKKLKLRPETQKTIAIKLAHLKEFDLAFFKKQCSDAKNPAKYFYWALRVNK